MIAGGGVGSEGVLDELAVEITDLRSQADTVD